MNEKYQKPKIVTGDLNTPVTFFEYQPSDGPDPSEQEKKTLYSCMALVYNSSMKDREILNAKGAKEGVTIKIRDPHESYIPTNKNKVMINDFRYQNKVWEIQDVAFDFEDNAFLKIVLGVTS
ncbi:MAG TPA: phage head-tail adapter protein [Ligilactobacillus acidipiscis]|uniref:Phage head-tail adapter protein n=1 Tax=Ligilactobacillus acidipiscis TaxID=89059 RepID=A0A921F8T6_9LACO|nr:phage head-tail adapter protein [Ligilactobacillus acidipiscis]